MMLHLLVFLLACDDNTEKGTEPEVVLDKSRSESSPRTLYRKLMNRLWVKVNCTLKQNPHRIKTNENSPC